ncbi:MAG: ABC-type transport auxiliary lipoprotein family protein [Pseudomonadota bacterium]
MAPRSRVVCGRLRWGALLTVALTAIALSGCTLFGTEGEPVATYRLAGTGAAVDAYAGEPCCLLEIRTPLPAPGFATARMVYQRNDYQNEAFAYAEWVDTLPTMLRASLIEAFDTLGRFDSVVSAPSPELPDYRLESRGLFVIQRFDGERSEVEVSLRVRVIDARERQLLGAQRFSVVKVAEPATPIGGVDAANRALDDLLLEISTYVLSLLEP